MKSERGITLVVLVITVILLIILSGVAITNTSVVSDSRHLNNMRADMIGLEENIQVYYNKYQTLPKTDRSKNIEGIPYYEIDLSRLNNITLNNGKDYGKPGQLQDEDDVYLVNDNLEVYYLKGVTEDENTTYHTYRQYDEEEI